MTHHAKVSDTTLSRILQDLKIFNLLWSVPVARCNVFKHTKYYTQATFNKRVEPNNKEQQKPTISKPRPPPPTRPEHKELLPISVRVILGFSNLFVRLDGTNCSGEPQHLSLGRYKRYEKYRFTVQIGKAYYLNIKMIVS